MDTDRQQALLYNLAADKMLLAAVVTIELKGMELENMEREQKGHAYAFGLEHFENLKERTEKKIEEINDRYKEAMS